MEEIYEILSIIKNKTTQEIINKLGIELKVIGRLHVLTPTIEGIKGVGVSISDNKILSIGFVLRRPISFSTISKELPFEYTCIYNYYDGETVVNLKYDEQINISCIKSGYIEKSDLSNTFFIEFNIVFK